MNGRPSSTAAHPVTMSPWLTTEQAAQYLGVSVSTLHKWRTQPRRHGPPFCKVTAKMTRYHRAELDRWMKRYRQEAA